MINFLAFIGFCWLAYGAWQEHESNQAIRLRNLLDERFEAAGARQVGGVEREAVKRVGWLIVMGV